MSHIKLEAPISKSQALLSLTKDVIGTFSQKYKSSKFLAVSQITGTTLFYKKFDSSVKYKGQLLGMGISALRTFILDSFQRPNVNLIKFDDLSIRIINIDDILVYYVYTGEEDDQETMFTRFIERLGSLESFQKYKSPVYNIYKKDEAEISLIVEEIFIN